MRLIPSCVLASLLLSTTTGFAPTRKRNTAQSTTWLHATLPTPEESAKALTDYMAKAHEAKLAAVKQAEAKKQAEIDELKKEVEALKAGTGGSMVTIGNSAAPSGSMEELQAKLSSYQSFITNYIVEAQEQKRLAVQQAEAAVAKKYEEKLLILGAVARPADVATIPPVANDLYSTRNAKVSAAAAAGKSRWGDLESHRASLVTGGNTLQMAEPVATVARLASPQEMYYQRRNERVVAAGKSSRWGPMEVQKAAGVAVTPIAASTPSTATIPVASLAARAIVTPDIIAAADHGLRSDGVVGGLTLAERLAAGARVASSDSAFATPQLLSFKMRNAKVVAAGKSSRWGPMEVQKATGVAVTPIAASTPSTATIPVASLAARAIVTPDIIAAADHGLRSDGGVGGLTLAERLTTGAVVTRPTVTHETMNYHIRNIKIAAAGKASRWGPMEVEKASKLAITPIVSVRSAVPPEVLAADHGLRNDGAVGGPTLAERVNLGAKLMGWTKLMGWQ